LVTRAVIFAAVVLAAAAPVHAIAEPKTLTVEDWNQIRPLFAFVEQTASRQLPPTDVALPWFCHFLNAEAGNVFVPFTIDVRSAHFTSYPVGMYLRVVKRGSPAPAPGPRDALAQYPFEDAAVFDRPDDGRISRAFAAPPGEYDVYVALIERTTPEHPIAAHVVLKHEVTVPDLASDLAVSSMFVLDKTEIDSGGRRLNFEEQLDEPYVWWGTKLTPSFRTSFGRRDKLSVSFVVYNAASAAGDKPDVEIQYAFYRRNDSAETFFVRTRPETFNADTLRREFSLSSGDLVVAGQAMPLASFPDGHYRLAITVTDKVSRKSITRDVVFDVAGS
jgi:hypothetical protein